jgi:hypothetical protein
VCVCRYFPRSVNILSTPSMDVNPLEISAAKQAVEIAKQNAINIQHRENRSISSLFNADNLNDNSYDNNNDHQNHMEMSMMHGSGSSGSSSGGMRQRAPSRVPTIGQHVLSDVGAGGLTEGDLEFAKRESRANCRFAAGRVLPKPHIAAMFSMACKC